jgi:hypothetical protein
MHRKRESARVQYARNAAFRGLEPGVALTVEPEGRTRKMVSLHLEYVRQPRFEWCHAACGRTRSLLRPERSCVVNRAFATRIIGDYYAGTCDRLPELNWHSSTAPSTVRAETMPPLPSS